MDSISKAEPVLSEEQLLLEVENELLKSKPSINVLAILNRNLFPPKIYEKLPIRLSLAPCLIIAEFKRLYPQYSFIEESCTFFVTKAFAGSSNHLESLLVLQCKLGSKKAKDLLFKKSESDDLVDELKIPAKYGPQVLFNSTQYGVHSRSGCEMISTDLRTIKEVLCVIVSIYYLLDLSYPSSFSQLMGLFHEMLLNESFEKKSKKTFSYIKQLT
ncbi:uncharacterized protein LOC136084689 isoform X2 [Hydra vulgaris]|uniref:Uncharacterized protein LOC136084689 isoform X2 n=1 Tax=Hydra vulgaris TaxID=6087 RepID=A0ABM4CHV7_HYDVU